MLSQHSNNVIDKLFKHTEIKAKFDKLIKKNNEYIGAALIPYIYATFIEIDRCRRLLDFDKSTFNTVCLSFLETLNEINFLRAYVLKGKESLTRVSSDSFDLDPASFKEFINTQKPLLKSIDHFIANKLGITNQKNQLIYAVNKIKNVINQYTGKNKLEYIADFNTSIDTLLKSAPALNYFELHHQVSADVKNCLHQLQQREESYYSGRFFASIRCRNSSLQPKIDEAKTLFTESTSNDIARYKR